jgi:hypothetical protein
MRNLVLPMYCVLLFCAFTPPSKKTPDMPVNSVLDKERILQIQKTFTCAYYGSILSQFTGDPMQVYWQFVMVDEAMEYGGFAFAVCKQRAGDEDVKAAITSAIAATRLCEEEEERHLKKYPQATPTPSPLQSPSPTISPKSDKT